jgi:hypothetical protein
MTIFAASFNPTTATVYAQTGFGFITFLTIPLTIRDSIRVAVSGASLTEKTFVLLTNGASLAAAAGVLLRTIGNLAKLSIPLYWLPPVQMVNAFFSVVFLGKSIKEYRDLKKLDHVLEKYDGHITISKESAHSYLSVDKKDYENFRKILAQEPDGGTAYLRRRIKDRLDNKKIEILAGVICVLAWTLFIGISFTPVAPIVIFAATVAGYALFLLSMGVTFYQIKHASQINDHLRCNTGGMIVKYHQLSPYLEKELQTDLPFEKVSIRWFPKAQDSVPAAA